MMTAPQANSTRVFDFSEETIVKRKRLMATMCASALLMLLGLSLLVMKRNEWPRLFGVFSFLGVLLAIEIVVLSRFMFKRFRQMRLCVDDLHLVRECGKTKQVVSWNQIMKMHKTQKPNREVYRIVIFPVNGQPLNIAGFESMPQVVKEIESRLPSATQVKTKTDPLDFERPLVMVGLMMAGIYSMISFYRSVGPRTGHRLEMLLLPGLGLFIIFRQPSSRLNPGFRKFELAAGVLMLLLGAFTLISDW
jgi:hypothetical protein